MNHIYRVVFNASLGVWQAVSEIGKGAGKGKSHARRHRTHLATLAGSLFLVSTQLYAASLPQNGVVTSGSGSISQPNTNTLNITQNTNKMVIDWNSFSVGQGNTVNFIQPSSSAIALNRVTGTDVSHIQGAINANGQVFLINPNGILFSTTAQVNVGALVASTRNISNDDFNNSHFKFEGSNGNAIINQGTIKTADGGYVVMVAAKIENTGNITANSGTVALAAGDRVILNMGGTVSIEVQQGAIDALIKNGGAIKADGGHILLTAKAAGDLAASVLNNTGMLDASSLSSVGGKMMLVADEITNSGSLYADGVSGGEVIVGNANNASTTIKSTSDIRADFVETSGKKLKVEDGVKIKAKQWLLDPTNITIGSGGSESLSGTPATTSTAGDVTVSVNTIQTALGNGSVLLQADNDITVNESLSWSTNTLTLTAGNDININAVVAPSGTAGLTMTTSTASGKGVKVGIDANGAFTGRVDMTGSGGLTINNAVYTAVTSAVELAAIGTDGTTLSGNYYLSDNITLSGSWTPLGDINIAQFTGKFNGLGHTVSGLVISRDSYSENGLFGSTNGALISNIGIINPSISITVTPDFGSGYTGALVGFAQDTNIYNSYVKSSDSAKKITSEGSFVGGLVGGFGSGALTGTGTNTISGSYANIIVEGADYSGGLVGSVYRYYDAYKNAIVDSYAKGNVTTTGGTVGGLIGSISAGDDGHIDLNHVYATGNVSGTEKVGGLIGEAELGLTSTIQNSYATGNINATGDSVGGFIGRLAQGDVTSNFTTLSNVYATGNVTSTGYNVAGLIGYLDAWQYGYVRIDHAHYANSDTGVSGDSYIGGLIGNANGYGSDNRSNIGIEKSYVTGTLTSSSGSDGDIGGFIGYASAGMFIKESYFEGTIDAPSGYAGGLVGEMPSTAWIADSYAKATFLNLGTTPEKVGGIIGKINYDSNQEDPFINRAYAISTFKEAGALSASVTTGIGGLFGTASVGGFSGFIDNTFILINDAFFSHDTAAVDAVGSDAAISTTSSKTDAELKDIRTFRTAGWNVAASDASSPYPSLTMGGASIWTMPYLELVYNNFLATGSTATLSSGTGASINFASNGTLTVVPTSTYLASDFKVTLQTASGNLNVDNEVSWSDFKLVLDSTGDININAPMSATSTAALEMNTGNGNLIKTSFNDDGTFKGKVDMAGTGELKINGDVYTRINNATELQAINTYVETISGDDFVTGNYYLGANIDASSITSFAPLGVKNFDDNNYAWITNTPFAGNFQGFGHTISGLAINTGSAIKSTGLFGSIELPTGSTSFIGNVGLVDANITGSENVGGLIGYIDTEESVTVSNAYVKGSVTSADTAGGLIGKMVSGTVLNSYTDTTVTSAGTAGGFIGSLEADTAVNLSSSYSKGSVSGASEVGGFVGKLSRWDTSGLVWIQNSYSQASVTGDTGAEAVGGFVGLMEAHTKITNSYATGAVSGVGKKGGFAGQVIFYPNYPNPELANNFWDTETTGQTLAFNKSSDYTTYVAENGSAGTVEGKTTAEMKALATYTGTTPAWDIDGDASGAYPRLTMGGSKAWNIYSPIVNTTATITAPSVSYGGFTGLTQIQPTGFTNSAAPVYGTDYDVVVKSDSTVLFDSADSTKNSLAILNGLNAGSYTLSVVAKGSSFAVSGTDTNFTIAKVNPTASFSNVTVTKTFGDSAYTQAPTVTTGVGAVTYTSSDTNVATVDATTGAVTVVGAGNATITATVASSTNYNGTVQTYALNVGKANPTASFSNATVTKTFGDSAYTQAPTVTTGAGAVTYTSSDSTVATVNPTTGAVTFVGAGSATITASVAESDNFFGNAASYSVEVTPNQVLASALTNAAKQPTVDVQKPMAESRLAPLAVPTPPAVAAGNSVGLASAPTSIGGMSVVAVAAETTPSDTNQTSATPDRKKDNGNNAQTGNEPTQSNQPKVEAAVKAESESRDLGVQKVFVIDGGIRTPIVINQ
jgi:filamentous hemagglutinin family protein